MAIAPTARSNCLRRWLGLEPNEHARSVVFYNLCAAILGFAWYEALLRLPISRDMLQFGAEDGWPADSVRMSIAFVATTCLVSTIFRRPVVRMRPTYLPLLAIFMMVFGAMVFVWIASALGVLAEESGGMWGHEDLSTVLLGGIVGAEMALVAGVVTIPSAILLVFLLRRAARAGRAHRSTPAASEDARSAGQVA